jgi:hypothetical protein
VNKGSVFSFKSINVKYRFFRHTGGRRYVLTGLDMTSINPDKNRGPRDKSVLTRIFMENSPILHNFLRRFLYRPQDIEDVVQETYLKAYAAEVMW